MTLWWPWGAVTLLDRLQVLEQILPPATIKTLPLSRAETAVLLSRA